MSNPFHDEKGDTNSMPKERVIYICEHCGERFDAGESDVDQTVECPHCRTETVLVAPEKPQPVKPMPEPVPEPEPQPARPAPPPAPEPKPEPKPKSESKTEPVEKPKADESLVKCRDCGKTISKRAEACPSCGRPRRVKPGIFYYVFTGTMSFVLTMVFLIAALVLLLERYFPAVYERVVVKGVILRFAETDETDAKAIPLTKIAALSGPAAPSEEEAATFGRMLVKANAGDPAAQHYVGYCYDVGQGVARDDHLAYGWYFKAALNNSPEAQSNLAGMFMDGRGVLQDYGAALKWYTRAAEQDLPWAQFNLGTLYDKGLGAPQNYKEAFKWYYRAADAGDPNAQFNVAMMHVDGQGANLDLAQALKWAILASSKGHKGAEELRRALTESDKRLTREQITQAQREASEFKPSGSGGN